jgi:membrane-bound ClpP family serine protease
MIMKINEHQMQEEQKTRGFRPSFFNWLTSPFLPRTDPRIMLILAIAAIASMIFGGVKDLIIGSLLLWFLVTLLIPILWGEGLCRRFGSKWGMIIAYAPLWLPFLLGLSAGLWLPIFGIH